MAEDTAAAEAAAAEAAAKAAADIKNDSQTDHGNKPPPPASNAPPPPTAEEKAALEKVEAEAAEAKAKTDAAEKAKADKTAEDEKDKTPLDTETWGSTGHEGADAALGLLQNAGVTPEEAKAMLFDAVSEGDLSKVDWKAVEAKIGADKTKLVKIGAEGFLRDTATRNTQIIKDISVVAGSEENWKTVAAWAKTNLDGDQLAEWRGMIDVGGAQARFAAGEIVAAFNADTNNSTLDTSGGNPEEKGDNTPGKTGEAVDRKEYAEKMAKLYQRGRVPTAGEIETLNAARARGRKREV